MSSRLYPEIFLFFKSLFHHRDEWDDDKKKDGFRGDTKLKKICPGI
jgi:hypothetical protein